MKRLTSDQRDRQIRTARLRLGRETRRKFKRRARRLKREVALGRRLAFARNYNVLFDQDLGREQIMLPGIFSFHDNYTETVAVIERMRETVFREGRPVMLHFTPVRQIDPSAALVLVAEIFRIRNLRSRKAVWGTYPRNRVIYHLLADMGFFDLLNIQERFGPPENADDPERHMFLQFISGNRVEPEAVDSFVSMVEKHLIPLNAVARGRLVGAIIEAMNNTLDHAHPDPVEGETMTRRWWLSARISIAEREIMILVFDQGVGIPNTLDTTLYDRVRAALEGLRRYEGLTADPSDGAKILAATELYRTGTGQPGRGKGFRNMKQFVDICTDGELRVLSNRGRYTYIAGTEAYANESLSIGGTVIEWRFRHEGSVEMSDE